jgi:predicted Zn-dependent protease
MKFSNNFLFVSLCKGLCLLLLVSQCLFPVRGHAMTIGEEREIGEKLLYSVRAELRLLDDPDISQYINNLGGQVLTVAGPQYFDYHFFVVRSDQFNAFAAPGGLVFFYTGLIQTMKTEDQLLSVLAHEIGHVVSRHIAQRVDKGGKINAITMGLALASLALGNPALSQGLFTGSLAAGQALNLHYSRQDEEQADRLSFGWLQEMRRNPVAMEEMLRTMRRITRYRSGKLPQYLLTHPNPEARLDYVQSLVESDEKQKFPGYYHQTDNFRFLRFKYRVMLQSMDLEQMRIVCTNRAAGPGNAEQKVMAQYGLALIALEEHNYIRGKELLKKVRESYPGQDILEVDMAVLQLAGGEVDKAVTLLTHAVKRDPTDMYAVFELAKAKAEQKDYDRAESLLGTVARVMPDYSQLYYELGRIKAGQGREGESNFYLGKYYLYEGRIKQARQYLGRSARDTTLPDSLRSEAKTILERLKELEEL